MAGPIETSTRNRLEAFHGHEDELKNVRAEAMRLARFIDNETEHSLKTFKDMDPRIANSAYDAYVLNVVYDGLILLNPDTTSYLFFDCVPCSSSLLFYKIAIICSIFSSCLRVY